MARIPTYLQIKSELSAEILSGQLPPHSQLPTEEALCQQYSVARGTVRQALQALVNDGLVYRLHGKGTFVQPRAYRYVVQTDHFTSFWHDFAQKGLESEIRVLETAYQDGMFHVKRLRLVNDTPMMVSVNHVPCAQPPEVSAGDLEHTSLHTLMGLEVTGGSRQLQAVAAPADIAALLDVSPGTPVLLVRQEAYDVENRCVDRADLWLRSDQFQFSIETRSL